MANILARENNKQQEERWKIHDNGEIFWQEKHKTMMGKVSNTKMDSEISDHNELARKTNNGK